MSFLDKREIRAVEIAADLASKNPFSATRQPLEAELLTLLPAARSTRSTEGSPADRLGERLTPLAEKVRQKLASKRVSPPERLIAVYRDFILMVLYHQFRADLTLMLEKPSSTSAPAALFQKFAEQVEHYFQFPVFRHHRGIDSAHLFACAWQIRRAYFVIDRSVAGSSAPALRLRADIWNSIFTSSMADYWTTLYSKIGDITTLVSGPSGTGKELVARSIALARFIPFDADRRRFQAASEDLFLPLNLAALSPTLIESELFGHCRGAFTGAVNDRKGRFEICHPLGTVFLDEIGEVSLEIQVKLLRVLESRRFQALGDNRDLNFHGKIITATNRCLSDEIQAGRFREDLYFRLCADLVVTPSLRERIDDFSGELDLLVRHLLDRWLGAEGAGFVDRVLSVIRSDVPAHYTWPGNIRELDQCIRNILVRGRYVPTSARTRGASTGLEELTRQVNDGQITADELLRHYIRHVYRITGSYEETARRLDLDRRTVRARIRDSADDE